jgi:hypothetical protein
VEAGPSRPALEQLAAEIQDAAWELALAAAEEGLVDDQIPSLQRLGRLGQLGDMPTFISELARELVDPQAERMRRGSTPASARPTASRRVRSSPSSCSCDASCGDSSRAARASSGSEPARCSLSSSG